MANQVLASELNTVDKDNTETRRMLVNPEFVQDTDKTDGSEMFTPEDQKLEDELSDA